jgi:hypothetical protein
MRRVHDALAQHLGACIEQRLEWDSRLEAELANALVQLLIARPRGHRQARDLLPVTF